MNNNFNETRNIKLLRKHLGECTVLLKKDDAFPLEKAGTIVAYGSGVRHTIKGGTGSGEVNSRYFINVEEGLKRAGFELLNTAWLDQYDQIRLKNKEEFFKAIKKKAKETKTNVIAASMGAIMLEADYQLPLNYDADVAIYVVGRISGEGNDRLDEKGDYRLTDTEVRDILDLNNHYEKFMLVINAGGPVDLTPVLEAKNILILSQLGVETGCALADILLGITYPSGKLSTSYAPYSSYGITNFGKKDDTDYTEGIFVGYRHFDCSIEKPTFPFGFGLGYTTFTYQVKEIKNEHANTSVSIQVSNTGKYAGKEVLQLYVSAPTGTLQKEYKSLVGFVKTKELQPQEEDLVTISFDLRNFSSYDEKQEAYILEKGDYILQVGTSSEEVQAIAVLELKDTFVVRKTQNLFPSIVKEVLPSFTNTIDTTNLPRYPLDFSIYETEVIDYTMKTYQDDLLNQLSIESLALLNMGGFNPKAGLLNVIGDASSKVAGAAGESTSLLKNQGIESIVVADGPAGLRLSRNYYVDEKGIHSIGATLPETVLELLPKPIKWFLSRSTKPKKGVTIFEQYTTAIPIGTAIAQSWNVEFAKLCGDIVGNEMETFHVDLWLAPALNIHRSVLCGRNFEYFSEDPILSAKMASAITLGVQSHPGKGVTIKHYAANNQETNRYGNSSNLTERTLRELYLKGFELCIKESNPMAIMSSYNLINGIHTSESKELSIDVLRNEWNYEGILMTDWLVGGDFLSKDPKYQNPTAPYVSRAGCTLFMPGSKKDYEALCKGISDDTVTVAQLKWNAHWFLQVLKRIQDKGSTK